MNIIKSSFSFFATTFIYLMGGFDVALKCLLITIVIDYITGILKAIKKKKLNSEVGSKGIVKKVGILCLVAIAVVIDELTGNHGVIRNLVIYYEVANEGLSIIENLGELNVGVPKIIKDTLEQLKEKK